MTVCYLPLLSVWEASRGTAEVDTSRLLICRPSPLDKGSGARDKGLDMPSSLIHSCHIPRGILQRGGRIRLL